MSLKREILNLKIFQIIKTKDIEIMLQLKYCQIEITNC